jgi:L-threonylcarbamoyladenylate synthase
MKINTSDETVYKTLVQIIKKGGIAIVPTDTVYGFAADAFNASAQKKIYEIKGRNYKKPLVIMVHDINKVGILVELSKSALRIAKKFFPGQLTLVLPTTPLGKLLSGGRDNLGVRIPNNAFMLNFLKELSTPIWTTSANISNKKSAKDIDEVLIFEPLVDIIINGGKCQHAMESTVIDMVKFPYTIIRKGTLNPTEILKYL